MLSLTNIMPALSRACRIAISTVLLLTATLSATTALAAGKPSKEAARMARDEAKKLQKDGWTLMGTRETLPQAMATYYVDYYAAGAEAMMFRSNAVGTDINRTLMQARKTGSATFAKMLSASITAETDNTIVNRQEGDSITTEQRMLHTSQAATRERITNLQPRYTLTRKLDGGQVEVMLLYLEK